jgi:elongation factor G
MPARPASDIRNVVLVGAGGAGKTTLTERLLFATGATKRMGSINEGNTVSDWADEEKHHKHSLQPSLVHFDHEGHLVNIIDTPGLVDFLGHAIACFPAVETVAIVIDAHRGVDSVTRRMMQVAEARKIPRMLIVSKIDEASSERLQELTNTIRETFGPICLPINLPSKGGKDVINVFEHDGNDAQGDDTDFSSVHDAHKQIVEQVIEVDDELTEQYLEKGEGFDPAKLHAAFEKCLGEAHLVPICFCSAKTGAGVDDLLHIFASLCPSPLEVSPPEFVYREKERADESEWHARPEPAAKLLAHVFRVVSDPFLGKIAIFRVHQGTLRAKGEVLINDQKKGVKLGHVFVMQGKEHVEAHEFGPGSIGAIAKIDEIHLNAVLHDSHEYDSVHLIPLPVPKPMYGLAIELKNHADETKFSGAMHKLVAEDPCLALDRIAATKQTVMRGLGELHLRVVLEKLRHMGIEVQTSPPKVAYKETITARADGHHRHKKQTGGAGQFGEVFLKVEPLNGDDAESFAFINDTVGGSIPKQFIPAVEKGVRQAFADGAIAGYPMTGIAVRVTDGKHHAVDSKEVAFVTAGKRAFIDAVQKARPVLMEPYAMLEISAPSKYMGDIAGHLSTKRGRVQSSDVLSGDVCVVRAVAPVGELQNYTNELKSMTGGAGTFTMDYSHDERTPSHIQDAVVAAFKPHHDED